ncbi:GTP-binding protein [Sulfurihydrogenibium sp.]|uniref:GTP-binding protein n=1 Tax=Sulfurihydrogenibium sp. TaxID=2053621 RepID=UPI002636B8C7|nr:GTP-binding protein [Sulfurihydrogenibium sp.]
MSEIMEKIRNFSIIALVVIGKSTLTYGLLSFKGGCKKREMKEQLLDTFSIERERGITVEV